MANQHRVPPAMSSYALRIVMLYSCFATQHAPRVVDRCDAFREAGIPLTMGAFRHVSSHNGNSIILEDDTGKHIETASGDTAYYYQLQHFIGVVYGMEVPITGASDAINNMKLIDRIYELV